MAKFGGWSKFGGASKFGGGTPWWQQIYRIMRSPPVAPAGFWPQDDTKLINKVLRTECKGLGEGKVSLEALANETFPQSCHDTIADWETLLNIVPSAGATLADRINVVWAKYRGNMGISLPELRATLYPVLHPETAFYDTFDFTHVGSLARWIKEGNGTRILSSSNAALTATSPTDADWLAGNANRISLRLNDIDDGFTWQTLVDSYSVAANTATGICAYEDDENAILFGFADDGSDKLRIDVFIEGELTENYGGVEIAAPAAAEFLVIDRDKTTKQISCKYGDTLAALTTLYTFDQPIRKIRKVGLYARNEAASTNTVQGQFDEAKLTHETPVNNLEIVEQIDAHCDLSGDHDAIFVAFIHRTPTDDGVYDIAQAQRICDSLKMGHTLILVGESAAFLCDDPYSLCDRDILGVW